MAAGFVLSLWMEHMADVPPSPPAPLNPFSEDWCFPGALSLEQKAGSVLFSASAPGQGTCPHGQSVFCVPVPKPSTHSRMAGE